MAQRRADAAPGDGAEKSVEDERVRIHDEDEADDKLPKPVIIPPPAPGLTSSWIAANPVNAWIAVVAQDTREAVLEQIGRSILDRFNADADMAVGRAVTSSWLENQLAAYSLPITLQDVQAATRSVFETNGVEVREG